MAMGPLRMRDAMDRGFLILKWYYFEGMPAMNCRSFVFLLSSLILSTHALAAVSDSSAVSGKHADSPIPQKYSPLATASIITDGMVLEQKSNVPLWGTGTPGAQISVRASWGKAAMTRVASDGSWMVKIATPRAGGPYTVTIREGDTAVVLKNILVGEVWLASGQSNMELPLEGWPPSDTILNSALEIRNANNPAIRMFTVAHAISLTPETSVSGTWSAASPETAGKFSATAYYFASALQASLHVPIGIIHSSWAGTPIEPWMSAGTIARFDKQKAMLEKVIAGKEERMNYAAWLNTFPTIEMSKRSGDTKWKGLNFQDEACSRQAYDDSLWKEMKLPQLWEQTEVGAFDGVVWFRKTVDVPSSWLNKKMTVELGPVDDMDITFVNGTRVGGMETEGLWNVDRIYPVPDSLARTTTVTIAVRVLDTHGGGGIYGRESQMVLRLSGTDETRSLAGAWKYLPVASYDGSVFQAYGAAGQKYYTHPAMGVPLNSHTPVVLFNAMIAPLVPYAIKGAIWYQGESNLGNAEEYQSLLPAMITDWRSKFQSGDFPFYYVQIAPFGGYGPGGHSELLREAQLSALSTKNTGMAVTLDIGSLRTIHPPDKKNVGQRLALLALAKNYGKLNPCSGPVYKTMKINRDKIVLTFANAGKGLVLKNAGDEFQIAGIDKIFKPARAEIRGKDLVVSSPDIQNPVAVRYAFTDTSAGVLFNADGLPSSSFRTDRWK
jgi:sialate O-acetylesterase